MKYGDDGDFAPLVVNLVHDDVGFFDQLARALDQSGASHLRKAVQLKKAYPVTNSDDHARSGRGVVPRNPRENTV